MDMKKENPAALAGANRANVTMPVSKDDGETNRVTCIDLQVRRLVARYMLSVQVAIVIAELAFSSGRAK
ncbi:hypothetical protein [Mesorhizobium amorphae]|uniref:Uncharacterized protein n=1 Tax=Mesorhizobium amorphae CCNWGS0123 TaxID=1082933 RepID=G6YDF8_9HYPH|nr:hypothetical protein [Mesorhizobium amorphae]ANT53268.1 hypothetical protein A6B35_27020 [Mesorhizobium amorphae CCNWGS0123]EHH10258.1 hypothetical protein MEA186_19977 [Mesorhizobium amorphae CCNWGS0123]GLR41166.1 hypothetical protein GCM10007880_16820 [Mesorhizobium amorphae]